MQQAVRRQLSGSKSCYSVGIVVRAPGCPLFSKGSWGTSGVVFYCQKILTYPQQLCFLGRYCLLGKASYCSVLSSSSWLHCNPYILVCSCVDYSCSVVYSIGISMHVFAVPSSVDLLSSPSGKLSLFYCWL